MSAPEWFESLTDELTIGVRERDGLTGLVLLGSASTAGRHRRDEWSDHDFFVIADPGRGARARASLDWLPDQDRIVLTACEGEIGFVVLYDDGHVLEFALAEPTELAGIAVGEVSVVVDDDAGVTAALVEAGQVTAAAGDSFDPENDARLVLVKILLGVGRIRRGEVLNGGQFVRTWAVNHLLRAVRGRFPGRSPEARDTIDPTRRFEVDYPDWARAIAAALDAPPERAAREPSSSRGAFSSLAGMHFPAVLQTRSRADSAGRAGNDRRLVPVSRENDLWPHRHRRCGHRSFSAEDWLRTP
ncbi:hypothetical protein [Salana multivorans]